MKCPYCAEKIEPDAVKCNQCGEWLERPERKRDGSLSANRCPFCAGEIQLEAVKCKHCGEWIERKKIASLVTSSGGGSGAGAGFWVFFIVVVLIGGYYFLFHINKTPEEEIQAPVNAEQRVENPKFLKYVDDGFITRMDERDNKAWVEPVWWASLAVEERRDLACEMAVYCASKEDNGRELVEIFDDKTEKLIARYDNSQYTGVEES